MYLRVGIEYIECNLEFKFLTTSFKYSKRISSINATVSGAGASSPNPKIISRTALKIKVSSISGPCSYRRTIFQEETFELGESVLFWSVFRSFIVLIVILFLFLGGHVSC